MREVEQEIASRWTDAVLLLHHCRTGHSTTRGLWAGAANSVPHSSASPHCIARSGLSDEWGTLLATPAKRSQLSVTQASTQERKVFRRVRIIEKKKKKHVRLYLRGSCRKDFLGI
jgi:hypothetical protein